MSRYERWIVSLAVLWLSACSTLPRPVGPDDEPRRAAAVNQSWIGVTKLWSRGCPIPDPASGWTVEPLIPPDKLEKDLQASLRRAKLNRFCVYKHTDTNLIYPETTQNPVVRESTLDLPAEIKARLRSVERDRVALAGSADTLAEMTWDPFYQRFLGQVQTLTLPIQGTSRIRLAFLDTQPTGDGIPQLDTPRNSDHGYTLAHIAGHLAGGQSSTIQIASRLALPLEEFNPPEGIEPQRNTVAGGFRGTFEDLANAIVNEVNEWKQQPESSRPRHLVLNLSVGWDGEKLGGWEQEENMSPDVQAVYRALEIAAENGVLVIASAGNELPGLDSKDLPVLPGGWEMLHQSGGPLVYAVSGVDGQDHPLVNTRARGEAPRVAYADHVVVPDLNNPRQPTATLTGTSVATAVVSTTAAAVWSYRPELEPAEVMRILSQAGDLLPRKPDFFAPSDDPSPEPVRRISLCKALYQACVPGAHCPTPVCAFPPEVLPLEPQLVAFTPESTVGPLSFSSFLRLPERRNLLDQPYILTHPGEDPCPNCTVTRNPPTAFTAPELDQIASATNASDFFETTVPSDTAYKLRIAIPSEWTTGELQEAALDITGFDPETGRKTPMVHCTVGAIGEPPTGGHTLEAICSGNPTKPFQATLSFTVIPASGGPALSIVSPLFVEF